MSKILIIEDNRDVRENIGELLDLSGYSTILATDGQDGIKKAMANPPDLIVCDIMMPKQDGYAVLRRFSKHHATMDIPFIFLTAKTNNEDIRKGMGMGADDYITKPFTETDLLSAVEVRLKKAARIKSFDNSAENVDQFFNSSIEASSLQSLPKEGQLNRYKKKEFVYREQDEPDFLYYIQSGKVKTFRTNEFGKELITAIARKGEFLGYTSLIKNSVHLESAQVMEPSELSLIPREAFLKLLYGDRDVSCQLIRLLANKLQDKEERLLKLAYDSVRRRVADALLISAKKNGLSSEKYDDVFRLRRADLANIAGSTKETVIRTMADFKEEGMLDIIAGKIKILDWEKIEELPN